MQRDRGRIDLDLVTLERSAIITRGGERRRERRYFARPSAGEGEKKEKKKKKNGPRLYNCSFLRPFFFNRAKPNRVYRVRCGIRTDVNFSYASHRERERERERNLCNSRINTKIRLLGARWTGIDICARALRPTICR